MPKCSSRAALSEKIWIIYFWKLGETKPKYHFLVGKLLTSYVPWSRGNLPSTGNLALSRMTWDHEIPSVLCKIRLTHVFFNGLMNSGTIELIRVRRVSGLCESVLCKVTCTAGDWRCRHSTNSLWANFLGEPLITSEDAAHWLGGVTLLFNWIVTLM